jgi:mRNA interferase MazF
LARQQEKRSGSYVPHRGDVAWLSFSPQAGAEQAGRRPGLFLSSKLYNRKTGLALCCPITSQQKGYPFEVVLPPGLAVTGVVLADHVKSTDWVARRATFVGTVPDELVQDVMARIIAMFDEE